MSTLVIHPYDPSTEFLAPIYNGIYSFPDEEKITIIRGGCSKESLKELIWEHDRVMMMGHGSPSGLFSVGQFPGSYMIIDDTIAPFLANNPNNIYIWCNADLFVKQHRLKGFYTGMFISEYSEASMCNVNTYKGEVEESNKLFAETVGKYINEDIRTIWLNTKRDYKLKGAVSNYNRDRLYLAD